MVKVMLDELKANHQLNPLDTEFVANDESQTALAHALTAYTATGTTPAGFNVVDAGNSKVPMTLDQLKGLTVAISSQVWSAFQNLPEMDKGQAVIGSAYHSYRSASRGLVITCLDL